MIIIINFDDIKEGSNREEGKVGGIFDKFGDMKGNEVIKEAIKFFFEDNGGENFRIKEGVRGVDDIGEGIKRRG